MIYDTSVLISALIDKISEIAPCYYEEAPISKNQFPYAILSGIHVTPLEGGESGDFVSFYLDVWADELKDTVADSDESATVELEELCDRLRSELSDERIAVDGVFFGHIGFENRSEVAEKEYDITHRRIGMTARIFFYEET